MNNTVEKSTKSKAESCKNTVENISPSPVKSVSSVVKLPSGSVTFDPDDNGPARRLTGKVAKLPREIQRIINEMLDETETYKAIVARLNDLGYPGFFEQNIQRWKDHGYQRWVQFQEKLEIAKREAEEAEELAKDPKNIVNLNLSNQMKQAMDTSRLWDAVSQWDTETTIKNRTFYFQLHRTTTQQAAEQTRRDRFNLEAELKRRKQEISEEGRQKIRDLTNPLTQAERKAILDAIDDILGIRIDPDDDGARVSPPAAMCNDTASVGTSPTDSVTQPLPSSCQGAATPENTTKPNNTVEKSAESKAKSCKNTVEKNEPSTPPKAPIALPSPGGEGQGESGLRVSSSHPPILPSSDPEESNTPENPCDFKAENKKNTVENQAAPTAVPSPGGEGQGEGGFYSQTIPATPTIQSSTNPPIQQVYRDPFPISPLATTPPAKKQPRNHIPLLDIYGQLIQWVPRNEELTIENVVGFGNRRGQNTCWLNPKLVDPPPVHRNVPIVSWEGQILEWVPTEVEPFEKAEPIRSRRYLHYKIGWWEQAREDHPQYNSSVGCMVA